MKDWTRLGVKPATQQPAMLPSAGAVAIVGGDRYAATALANEVSAISTWPQGSRNDRLNLGAFNMGQLVPLGRITEAEVTEALYAAGMACGLEPGETRDTIRSGIAKGKDHPRDIKPLELVTADVTEVDASELVQVEPVTGGDVTERTSWWPVNIVTAVASARDAPRPTHLRRDDGEFLLYSGKVNGLIGESESGKSWVQQLAIVQALKVGERVLLMDFEDSAGGILARLTSLGANEADLARFDYASPAESLGLMAAADLSEALANGYGLIGVDGVNAAMTLLGYDINSNTDATLFAQKVLRPMSATGASVLTVDHVPKNSEARGKGGIGAQAKRAMIDGCCIAVEVAEPFGRGQNGILRLRVDKDRPGYVRGISAGSTFVGRALVSSAADRVGIIITTPDLRPGSEKGEFRPTGLMEKLSRWLEWQSEPAGFNQVAAAMHKRKVDEHLKAAVRELSSGGFIELHDGPRGAVLHLSKRPYRQSEDPASDEFPRPVPTGSPLVPGTGQVDRFPPPPIPTGGEPVKTILETGSTGSQFRAGFSACNLCGEDTEDKIINDFGGYCRNCEKRVHG